MPICPIPGCPRPLSDQAHEPMCRFHYATVSAPLRRTIARLWNGNGQVGNPFPGYEDACANAIERVARRESKRR